MSVAQRLRQKLLDLAIHGKLVPQCAKDEPAGELLERIRNEELGIRNCQRKGKIGLTGFTGLSDGKRNPGNRVNPVRKYPPIPEEEIPFDLPRGWVWCRLGEIFDMHAGKHISADEISSTQTDSCPYPCYGGNGVRGYVSRYNAEGSLAIVGRQGALCGNVQIASGRFYATEHAVIVDSAGGMEADFVGLFLTALNLNQYATATAQPGLSVAKICEEVLFPLPPLTEQKRIVEKLNAMLKEATRVAEGTERLAQLRKKAKAKILDLAIRGKLVKQEKSDEPASKLLKRIAAEKAKLVSGKKIKKEKPLPPIAEDEIPFDLPKGWTWARLGNVLRVINVGIVIKPTRYYTDKEGIMAFRNSNVGEGFVDRRNWVQISHKGTKENPRCVLHEGDIAIARSGKPGVACPITKEFEGYAAIDILIATPFADFVDDEYLCFCINNSTAQRVILGMNRGIAQSHIGATSIVNLPIPLPPLAEQRRVVAKVKEMLVACDMITKGGSL